MIIGERLREIRKLKGLSQADLEQRTGLLGCYISRIENGHMIPAIDTLERLAKGLEVPLYQLFYDAEAPPELPAPSDGEKNNLDEWTAHGKQAWVWQRLRTLLGQMDQGDRNLLLCLAQKVASRNKT
jgi:transcriptional regulator with XRE-family HTH domain